MYSDICHSSDICKNRAYFIDLLSLNSQSPITLEWLWEQLHRRFNSAERCHSQSDWIWIAIAVWLEQCSELSLLWWRLVMCRVFLNGTRHCWPFSPTAFSHFDLSDQDSWQTATSFFLSFSSLHNEGVITLQLVDFTKLHKRGDRERERERIWKEYRKYNLLLLSTKQTFL